MVSHEQVRSDGRDGRSGAVRKCSWRLFLPIHNRATFRPVVGGKTVFQPSRTGVGRRAGERT
jgi:hypothetical protein